MATSKAEIREWLQDAQKDKATHVIVVCDTFDHEDYPVYVYADEDVRERVKQYDGINMQRITEVYDLSMDLEEQLNADRVFNY